MPRSHAPYPDEFRRRMVELVCGVSLVVCGVSLVRWYLGEAEASDEIVTQAFDGLPSVHLLL
jgi:hypothetical protein